LSAQTSSHEGHSTAGRTAVVEAAGSLRCFAAPSLAKNKWEEAVALVRRGTRSAGVLSHPWFSPDDPDPEGFKFRIVRKALSGRCVNIEGFFLVRSLDTSPRLYPLRAIPFAPLRLSDLLACTFLTRHLCRISRPCTRSHVMRCKSWPSEIH
jgi:hypothetical protein